MNNRRQDGQILVLFALVLIGLLGVSAIVVDVAFKYASERRYQSVTDAAALAGAQDLLGATRGSNPTSLDYQRAATNALKIVLDSLEPGKTTSCDPTTLPIVDCQLSNGSPYQVTIRTPASTCVDCDVNRAVQVTVREPAHAVTLARIFGQSTWNLARTSVAGLSFQRKYAIVTLRPPRPVGNSTEVRDIRLDGGTTVRVSSGDVGTNSNMNYASTNSLMTLDSGYRLYYYDATPTWSGPPVSTRLSALIADPMYPIPAAPATAAYTTLGQAEDTANCQALVTSKLVSVTAYEALVPKFTSGPNAGKYDWSQVHCYTPGNYSVTLADKNGELTVLEPGLYYMNGGVDVQANMVGGFDPSTGGVSLVFPRDQQFKQRSGALLLNAGTKYKNSAGSEPATAPAMTGTTPNLKMTVLVQKDPNCQIVLPYNTGCNDLSNDSVNLAGGTAVYLAGVQYGASDNMKIAGGSDGTGYVGQVWAWTLFYTGSSQINQEGAGRDRVGKVRIDTACSPGVADPGGLCN